MNNKKDTLFFNVSLTDALISALVRQRQLESFCDVQIKIGQRQFSLHSNVLAAVSPYFAAFLSQELPRGFSQLTPQVIEIQVVSDYVGSNDICEMAVEAVVDYMYTGIVRFHTDTIIHIAEIAKAMQLDELVKFCQDFISGNASTNIQFKTVLENEDGKEEIDQSNLKTEECLTNEDCSAVEGSSILYPKKIVTLPGLELLTSSVDNLASINLNGKNNDLFIETIKLDEAAIDSCTFVGVTNLSSCTNTEIQPLSLRVNPFSDSGNNTSVSVEETSVQNTLFNSNKPEVHPPPRQSTRHRRKTFKVSGSETGFVNKRSRHLLLDGDSISVVDNRFMGKNLQPITTAKIAVGVVEEENGIVVKQNDVLDSKTSCRAIKVLKSKCNDPSDDLLNRLFPETKKFSCSLCTFKTSNVRRMSSHNKQHKHAKNTCYYCELKFKDKAQLELHAVIHSNQSMPFVCRTCNQHFQSNTQLLLHLPKHSDEKPYVCEICRTGFKWKSALKSHMVTHADLKEHLCDVCGYTTAHRSQLKAHRLVHTGETMRCSYEGCDFHALKLQNLKYHLLTHTQEKAHQCEVCGQSFSLVKNMKRHMLLHMSKKNHICTHCDFASTRFDKLKEHLHKQHNVGSAPEKRLRISDMVGKKSPSNETIDANDAAVQEANPELEVLCDGDYHMVEFELSDGLAMIDGTQEMSYYCFQSISEQA